MPNPKAINIESDIFFPHFSLCDGTGGGAFWSLLSPIVFILILNKFLIRTQFAAVEV